MTSNSSAQRRARSDRQRRRRWRAAFERLEDRRLLTWTFSISGSIATATSDGSADMLYIVQSGGYLYHSVDGTNFSSDWSGSGTTLAASTSSTVNIDPTSGSNAHNIFVGYSVLSPASTIQAQINIINGGPNVALKIDDSTDTSAASGTNAYSINNGAVSTPLGINVNGPTNGTVLGGGITLEGGSAADTYNTTGTPVGEPITLTGGNGGNTFNITGNSSPTAINVGSGTNTVSVGGASGVGAQNVTGAVTVSGSGSTTVALDNLLGTNTPETVNMTATQITGVAPATVDFGGLTNISTFAFGTTNLGGATINVQGAPAVSSTVRIVDGSGGTNSINLGDATHAASALPAELFQLVSTGSTTNLTVDDSADTSPAIATVTSSTVNFGATHQPNINFASASLASLTLDGGSGGNTINVTGTPSSITTTIDSGSGVDSVAVQATGSGSTLALDTQGGTANNVTLGGVSGVGAQNIRGTINVQSTGGSVALTVDDSQDSTARTVSLSSTALTGLTPMAIGLSANVSALTAKGGSGGNTFTVTGTLVGIATTIDTGSGVDSVAVQATGPGGTLAIDAQGGTANDVTLGGVSGTGAQALLEPVTVQSTGGSVALTIDDSQDGVDRSNVLMNGSQLNGLTPSSIGFSNLASLTVDLSSGTDAVQVLGTPAGATTTLSFSSSTSNALTLGSPTAAASTLGSMTLNGTFGATIDDSTDTTGGTITFQGAGISFGSSPLPTFGYFGDYIESLRIDAPATAAETIDVAFSPYLPMGNQILLVMGSSTGNTVEIGTGGLGATRLNGVTVTGTTAVTIDDTNSTGAHTATITSSSLAFGTSMPTFDYSGAMLTGLTYDANSSGGTADVQGSPNAMSGLAPITLAMGAAAGSSVNLSNRADALGNVTVTTSTGGSTGLVVDDSNGSGSWTYSVSATGLGIAGGPTFTYGGATLSGLQLNVNNNGGNTVDVTGTPALPMGQSLTIVAFTGMGNSVNLGDATHAASALGDVSISSGSSGPLAVTVDDTNDSAAAEVSIGVAGLAFGASPLPTFDYSGATLASLTFKGGSGGNTIAVANTPSNLATTIDSGSGVDSVGVLGVGAGGSLIVDTQGGASADNVTLGGATGIGTQAIDSPVTVQSTGGAVNLTVDDSQDATARTVTLGPAQITGLAPATIGFSNLALLTLDGGSGGNTIDVTGTPGGIATSLNTGSGIDSVQVQGTGAGGTLNLDTQGGLSPNTVVLGGASGIGAQGLQGTIYVASTGGAAVLDVNDGADATGRSISIGNVSPAEATIVGIAPATIDVALAAVGNLGIETGTAASTLTVDCTTGDPLPAILRFTGAGANTLDLQGSGANFTSETYAATGPGAGSIDFDSAHQVLFNQLIPINDTVPVATFTFNAPSGSTAVNVVDGPTVGGLATTEVASPTGAFELINFANKPTATLNASGSGTAILLNNPTPAAGLHALTINGGAGNDNATIQAAPVGVTTVLDLGGGDDQASLTPAALPATGSLAIDGGTGTNTVTADAATTTADTGTPGSIGFGTGGSFTYRNVQALNVTALNSPPVLSPGSPLSTTAGQALTDAVVATFTDPNTVENAGAYRATISWDDGATSAGTVVADPVHAGTFDVIGSHTYANAGTYTTSVGVTDGGGTFASTSGSTAVSTTLAPLSSPVVGHAAVVDIKSPPSANHITGSVNTGPFGGRMLPDGFTVTVDTTPSFSGTATPGTFIQVFATGTSAGATSVLIATTTADASGNWSTATVRPLPDGVYTISASATSTPAPLMVGPMAAVAPVLTPIGGLVVDTHGPVVDAISFHRLHGLVYLDFQDGLSGLDPATLANAANYQVKARPVTAAVHVRKRITVTHVAILPSVSPTAPVGVVLTLNHGRPLRGGHYTFKVLAPGVRDMAGNPLNGAFKGTFPTGGGLYATATTPGGSNFLAKITAFHRRVFPAVPETTRTAHVRKARSLELTPTISTPIPQSPGHVHDAALSAVAFSVKRKPTRR